jgi:hypothetical protein
MSLTHLYKFEVFNSKFWLPWLQWTMTNPNPLLIKAHLTALNLNNVKMNKAKGLK